MKKNDKKQSIVKEYIQYHEKYVEQFGKERTLVLMQVGKFYEAYGTNTVGPDLFKLEDITDAAVARKGMDVSLKYPYMWGFPTSSSPKYMTLLIDSGYHLIVFDQIKDGCCIRRELTGIFSPATYIESINKSSSNFIVNIVVDEIVQKSGKPVCIVGMSAIDVSTGEVYVHESLSDMDDESLGLDETIRFLNGLNPKEIIIEKDNFVNLREKHIIEYLDLEGKYYQFRDFNGKHAKLNYQRKLFEHIYSNSKGVASIFDSLNITKTIYARKSLAALLTYLSDHSEKFTTGIKEPKFYIDNKFLILGNDAINQLNIVHSTRSNDSTTKINNLLDVINKAATHMGKRYVQMKLVSPLTDPNELNKIYDIVEYLMHNGFYMKVEPHLKGISDIERLERKMALAMLNPIEFATFARSFESVLELFNTIKTKNNLTKYIRTSHLRKRIAQMSATINELFDLDKCKLFSNQKDIKENVFKRGIYKDLDKMQDDIGIGQELMEELQRALSEMINDEIANGLKVQLKHNKTDGYYFYMTKKRFDILYPQLNEIEIIELHSHSINIKDFEYKEMKDAVKMYAPFLKSKTDNIDALEERIKTAVFEHYTNKLNDIYGEYVKEIKESICIVTAVDYYYCIAKVSRIHNYVRPNIRKICDKDTESYIDAKALRHPIVEQIIDHEYIPHDILIGTDLKGMMIYGLNSAGKSVLMKAIGISIIMAQAGFFVSAAEFEYYPYQALYTRITGNDNLFRGLSTFSLEMVELGAILKRADRNTLVIGDEVCKSTEHISGNSLVAATLLNLVEHRSTFVFATHLHELMGLKQIQDIEQIKAFHLSVEFNETTDYLVYDRELKPGPGERIYGIVVAKSIIRNAAFINKALEFKNILLNNDPNLSLIGSKKSKYNAEMIIDRCKLCGKKNTHLGPTPLEVHHINHQADCKDGFVKSKPHLKKNHLSNLIEICQDCHDSVHNGTIVIKGYRITSSGREIIVEKRNGGGEYIKSVIDCSHDDTEIEKISDGTDIEKISDEADIISFEDVKSKKLKLNRFDDNKNTKTKSRKK